MYKVSGRNESAFSPLLDSPPAADSHMTNAYTMYKWPPRPQYMISKVGAVNRNERLALQVAKQSEQTCEANKGLHKDPEHAEPPAGDST